jgi:hypothetical protein
MTDPCRAALAEERAKFEAWARNEGMDVGYWLNNVEHGYDNTRVADYWTGWKARAVLAQEAVPHGNASMNSHLTDSDGSQVPEAKLRALFAHWNEFGPEHGFGELIDRMQPKGGA